MPLSKLEYTANIHIADDAMVSFFKDLHQKMTDLIGTELSSCKASALKLNSYCIANDDKKIGFITLLIQILPGRDDQTKMMLKNMAGKLLHDLLDVAGIRSKVQVRALVTEIDKNLYFMEDYPSYRPPST